MTQPEANGLAAADADFAAAETFFRSAAQHNTTLSPAEVAYAHSSLGEMYLRGGHGLAQDFERAHESLREGAEGGHAMAMANLGWQISKRAQGFPEGPEEGSEGKPLGKRVGKVRAGNARAPKVDPVAWAKAKKERAEKAKNMRDARLFGM